MSQDTQTQSIGLNSPPELRVSFAEVKEAIAHPSFGMNDSHHSRRVSTLSGGGMTSSQTLRKIVHFENPRKYINFEQTLETESELASIAEIPQSFSGLRTKKHASQSINSISKSQSQQQLVLVSANPVYRFKIPTELDAKYRQESNSMQEELIRKIERLELVHAEEIHKLKATFQDEQSRLVSLIEQERNVIHQTRSTSLNNEEMKVELVQSKEQLHIVNQSVSRLEGEVQGLRNTILQKNILIEQLQGIQDQLPELQSLRDSLELQCKELQYSKSSLSAENKMAVASLEFKVQHLERDLADQRKEIESSRKQLSEAQTNQNELVLLRDANQTLKRKVDKAKLVKESLVSLKEQVRRLEASELEKTHLIAQQQELLQAGGVHRNEQQQSLQAQHETGLLKYRSNDELTELRSQNELLVNELGRITEEYQEYKRRGAIVEKPVYVETKTNVTTVKEVPAKIEERIVYVQDSVQTEKLQRFIKEQQEQIVSLSREKSAMMQVRRIIVNFSTIYHNIQSHVEEKNSLLTKLSDLASLQQSVEPQVLREVIIERVVDRVEVNQKHREIQELQEQLARERIRSAQLSEEVAHLEKELTRFSTQFKLVKLPNSYRIEQSSSSLGETQSLLNLNVPRYTTATVGQKVGVSNQSGIAGIGSRQVDGYETISRKVVNQSKYIQSQSGY